MTWVLATRNVKKRRELEQILAGLPVELHTLDAYPAVGEVEETGQTFEENARLKAREVARQTGRLALADDSGLVVDALGGAPGVYSARYSGPDATDASNRVKLLQALDGVAEGLRTARFVAVICLAEPDGEVLVEARGTCEGRIGLAEEGEGGFGYDPLFVVDALNRTMASLSPAEKHGVSHRGKALAVLLAAVRSGTLARRPGG